MTDDKMYPEARAAVAAAAHELYENGVMSFSGHCNLSARVDKDRMVLTNIPGHVRTATPETINVLTIAGEAIQGDFLPGNAEIIAMHGEVYKRYPHIKAIIHTHSPHLLAFAMANQPLGCRYEGLLRFGQASEVPVVPWAPRGSEHSVGGILATMAQYPDSKAVLLGNHGVLVTGATPAETAHLLIVLEEAAQGEINARPIGGAVEFPSGALESVRESMDRAARSVGHDHSHESE